MDNQKSPSAKQLPGASDSDSPWHPSHASSKIVGLLSDASIDEAVFVSPAHLEARATVASVAQLDSVARQLILSESKLDLYNFPESPGMLNPYPMPNNYRLEFYHDFFSEYTGIIPRQHSGFLTADHRSIRELG
jgi:hypothetical protein